ncbi:MAG TPA: hypothetical protein VLL25_00720, partial [Acidimicrobiales bacterium]|nr:hypothetical protein [Acidimicrobiales bacterium]
MSARSLHYPAARRMDLVETIHGQPVADPYRWLEDAKSPETTEWSTAEDQLCQEWFAGVRGRDDLRAHLEELLPGFVGPPIVIGERRFFLRRLPGQDHAVLWVEEGGEERVLIDPNALTPDHTVTLDAWQPSLEGDLLAYQLSEGGDEESVLRIMDVATGEIIDGPIDRMRYSPVAWLPGGDAVYYVRRLAPGEVPEGEEQFHRRVYLHRLGTDPSLDRMVFGDDTDKTAYFGLDVARSGRWLAVTVNLGTAPRNDCYLGDLAGPGGPAAPLWRTIIQGVDAQAWPALGDDDRVYLITDADAPRRRLVVADPESPAAANWKELIAEDPDGWVLDGVALAGDRLVALYRRHAVSRVTLHDRASGARRGEVSLPGLGTADIVGRPDEGLEVWIGYTDHVTPYRVLHLDVTTETVTPWADPPGWTGPTVDAGQISTEQLMYQSADGTEVRMFVIAAKRNGSERPRPA